MAKKKQRKVSVEYEAADLTNPEILALCGLKLKGREIVSADEEEVVLGELTEEDYARVQARGK